MVSVAIKDPVDFPRFNPTGVCICRSQMPEALPTTVLTAGRDWHLYQQLASASAAVQVQDAA